MQQCVSKYYLGREKWLGSVFIRRDIQYLYRESYMEAHSLSKAEFLIENNNGNILEYYTFFMN